MRPDAHPMREIRFGEPGDLLSSITRARSGILRAMNATTERRKILIVDDETTVAETLALVFSSRGFICRTAFSAEQAIELIADWRPDVAIVDVMLPRLNGIELAGIISENHPGCRTVLISGHPSASELLPSAGERTLQILPKPLHPSLILETVANILTGGKDTTDA